ncbi:hypothetical protein WA158_000052 [Blastocystis sp. Blastoise]
MAFPKGLLLVHLTVFIDCFGYAFIMPIIPFFADKLGGTSFELGLTISSYALFQALSVVVMGSLSDIYGRRLLLLLSLFGSFTGPLLQSFSWCMWAFIVFRGYTGLLGGSQTIGQAYIADVTSTEDRSKYMAQQGAIISSAFVFGPAIGGFLSNYLLESPFWLASACAFIVFIIAIFGLQETNKKIIKKNELEKERKTLLKKTALSNEESMRVDEIKNEIHKLMEKPKVKAESEKIHWNARMVIMVLARFFNEAVAIIFDSMIGLYMKDNFGATSLDISGVQCMTGIVTLLIQMFIVPPLVKCLSLQRTAVIASIITTCGAIYMAYSYDLLSTYLSVGLMFSGYSLLFPLIPTVLSTEAPKNSQGTVLSIGIMAGQVAMVIVPSLAGVIYEYSPFWSILSGGVSGCCLVILMILLNILWGVSNVEKYYKEEEKEKDIEENNKEEDNKKEEDNNQDKEKVNIIVPDTTSSNGNNNSPSLPVPDTAISTNNNQSITTSVSSI